MASEALGALVRRWLRRRLRSDHGSACELPFNEEAVHDAVLSQSPARAESTCRGSSTLPSVWSDDLDVVDLERDRWRVLLADLSRRPARPARLSLRRPSPHTSWSAQRSEQFDEAQQQEIDDVRDSSARGSWDSMRRRSSSIWIVRKDQLKERELRPRLRTSLDQLPPFVWTRFRNRHRIPIRRPFEVAFAEGG